MNHVNAHASFLRTPVATPFGEDDHALAQISELAVP